MAPTANSQPSQTSHVELEQTMSAWSQKLPTQLNTPDLFPNSVPSLPKRFRGPTVGPVCFRLNSDQTRELVGVQVGVFVCEKAQNSLWCNILVTETETFVVVALDKRVETEATAECLILAVLPCPSPWVPW